jgi:hypothetical protein
MNREGDKEGREIVFMPNGKEKTPSVPSTETKKKSDYERITTIFEKSSYSIKFY